MTIYQKIQADSLTVPDHALLVAGAAVSQASTATAVLAERIAARHVSAPEDPLTALVGVFDGGSACDAAALRGSFHPRIALASADKARSRLMKPGFTLAF